MKLGEKVQLVPHYQPTTLLYFTLLYFTLLHYYYRPYKAANDNITTFVPTTMHTTPATTTTTTTCTTTTTTTTSPRANSNYRLYLKHPKPDS